MLISTVFVLMLISTLYRASNTLAVVGQTDALSAVGDDIKQKLDGFGAQLKQIDVSLQQLHEKSNTWTIFRHNIEAWNAQMEAIEHKLTLIKGTQDEHQHKLTSLELTLNHVLSKVIFLSDVDVHRVGQRTEHREERNSNNGIGNQKDHKHLDKRIMLELSARLNNVLRHLQNIEGNKCRSGGGVQETPNDDETKVGKLMLSTMTSTATAGVVGEQRFDIDKSLRKLEQKLNILLANLQPKDIKQMQTLTKKNARSLEGIESTLSQLSTQQQLGAKNWDQMTDYCQSVSGELTTFTESSDLLLKRIEIVVKDVSDRLKTVDKATVNVTHNDDGVTVEQHTEHPVVLTADSDEDTEESVEHVEVVEFVQPNKSDCSELGEPRIDGIYKFLSPQLNEDQRDFNERFCAFATDGAAWTVIQNRGPYVEQENFNRSWSEYRNGFGSLSKDFWFGNEYMRILANRDDYELRIELEDFDGGHAWLEYDDFRLDSENYNYNLMIGNCRGSIIDAMHYHNEMDFSTYDHQNDRSSGEACAVGFGGGWWFDNCSETNLNGIYHDTPMGHNYVGIIWEHWHGDYSLKGARMMIRPRRQPSGGVEESTVAAPAYNELTDEK